MNDTTNISPLLITDYDESGYGVGSFVRKDGVLRRARIFGSLVGEVVLPAAFVKSKKYKGFYDGIDSAIVQPSSQRVLPQCPHVGSCGGCVWQHMDIAQQSIVKETYVQKLFQDAFGALLESVVWFPMIAVHQASWRYRNKIECSFAQDRKGTKFLGFYDRLGRGVVPIRECHLAPEWMTQALHAAKSWWEGEACSLTALRHSTGEGTLRTLTMREGRSTGDRMVILTVSSRPEYAPTKEQLQALKRRMEEVMGAASQNSTVVRIHQALRGVPTQIYEMVLSGSGYIRENIAISVDGKNIECLFQISPQSFFQPNTRAAVALYAQALSMAKILPEDTVYDLYCGTGTIGILAAHFAQAVVGIELSKEAAFDARCQAERIGLNNIQIYAGDTGEVLKTVRKEGQDPIVIIDPPRTGLHPRALQEIVALLPKRIIYVSCHPAHQARDIKELLAGGLYTISSICSVDQFPHTPHIENIVALERNENVRSQEIDGNLLS